MFNKHFFKILVVFVGMLLLGIIFLFAINQWSDTSENPGERTQGAGNI